jgi:hypothetical protein
MMYFQAVLLLSWLAAACAGNRNPDMFDASPRTEITLTSTIPSTELPLGTVPRDPEAMEVVIVRIANPAAQAFSVRLGVVPGGAGKPGRAVDIGSFTPFPADRAGKYLVAIPEPARAVLARRDPGTRLRVSLVPVSPQRPLPASLEVVVAEPSWRGPRDQGVR